MNENNMNQQNTKPACPCGAERPADPGRRQFLHRLSIGLGGLAGAIMALPPLGFIVAQISRNTGQAWRKVGKVEKFTVGDTVAVAFENASPLSWAGVTAKSGAWLRRESEDTFIAFALNCSHLGCPVRWLKNPELFMCPCHGGVYYKDGSVAAGPPPHALTRYAVRVRDGEVELQTGPIPITT